MTGLFAGVNPTVLSQGHFITLPDFELGGLLYFKTYLGHLWR